MKLIFEKEYGDGSVLSVKEMPHPVLGVMVPTISFNMGGGKGVNAALSTLAGEDFLVEMVVALANYLDAENAEDKKDGLALVADKGSK
jgi:hypothetical protein